MVFDKTGTLTEDGLSVHSFKIRSERHFHKKISGKKGVLTDVDCFTDKNTYLKMKDDITVKYVECMASWHQVALLNGQWFGDPLDIEMFKATKWSIIDNQDEIVSTEQTVEQYFYPPEVMSKIQDNTEYKKDWYQLKLEHKFDFSSALQRMSAIVSNRFDEKNKYILFVKGSPEMIEKLSIPETLPRDYKTALKKYTQKGLRVIALAYKYYPDFNPKTTEKLKREDVEHTLIFLGFLILVNKLKHATKGAIKELREGKPIALSLK